MINSPGISPLSMYNPQAELPESASARKSRMLEICSEFEGAMTAAMFKEGLRAAVKSADDEDESGGTQAYMEMAMDQLAFISGSRECWAWLTCLSIHCHPQIQRGAPPMVTQIHPPPSEVPSLYNKLRESIQALTDAAVRLRNAIVHRNVDEIWEILAEQEEESARLQQYSRLWNQVFGDDDSPATAEDGTPDPREGIRSDLHALRQVERSNAVLCRSYLGAIRKSLVRAGAGAKRGAKTYNKRGRMGTRNASFLIRRIG